MKNTWKVAVAAAALMGSASVARADLTLNGQTGLFANPTAEVAKKGAPEIEVNYNRLSADGEHVSGYGVGFAFSPIKKLELNADVNRYSFIDERDPGSHLGLKYQLVHNTKKGLDVAVGANYGHQGYDTYDYDQATLYAAVTQKFNLSHNRAPIKGTLGARWDHFSEVGESWSTSKGSVYAGVDIPVTRDGQFSLVGEVGSKVIDHGDSTYAIGVRYRPKSSGFSAAVGYGRLASDNFGAIVASDNSQSFHNFFVQLGYTFGK